MASSSSIDITTTLSRATSKEVARLIPFARMKSRAIGERYELSLVICGDKLARALNRAHRGKTYAANVLSFPLARAEGEIFLNLRAAEREAKRYGSTLERRLALLFVHGLLHLKGMHHGRTMEAQERHILRAFDLE